MPNTENKKPYENGMPTVDAKQEVARQQKYKNLERDKGFRKQSLNQLVKEEYLSYAIKYYEQIAKLYIKDSQTTFPAISKIVGIINDNYPQVALETFSNMQVINNHESNYGFEAITDIKSYSKKLGFVGVTEGIKEPKKNNRAENNIPLRALNDVVKLFKISKEVWEYHNTADGHENLTPLTLELFGQKASRVLNAEFLPGKQTGKLTAADYTSDKFAFDQIPLLKAMIEKGSVYFDGIDASYTPTNPNSTGARTAFVGSNLGLEKEVPALIYDGTVNEMAYRIGKIVADRGYNGRWHSQVANEIMNYMQTAEFKENGLVVAALSNGVIQNYAIQNQIANALEEKYGDHTNLNGDYIKNQVRNDLNDIRTVNFGIQPLYYKETDASGRDSDIVFSNFVNHVM